MKFIGGYTVKKLFLAVLMITIMAVPCLAQNKTYTLLNAATSTGDGTAQGMRTFAEKFSCGVTWGGTPPTTVTVILKGSADGVTYDDLSTNTFTVPTEKITNGTFTGNANSWTVGSGYTYSDNTVLKNGNGTAALTQASAAMASAIVPGERYTLRFTLSAWSVGTVTPSIGGATGTAVGSDATFEQSFVATDTTALAFTPTNTARFTIDGVSLIKQGKMFHVVNKGVYYIKGSYSAKTGGDTDTAITMTCIAQD